jgi:hypothetical protein
VFGVVQELESHRLGLGILILQQITDLPFVFSGSFRIAISGREITDIEGEWIR